MSTHADRFDANRAYSVYKKGAVFLGQLKYIIGEENFNKTFKEYFRLWSFKHPTPNDFLRIAEKVSRLQLDWYLMDWINTTKTIDYGIKNVEQNKVVLERIGGVPMPTEVFVSYTDGTDEKFYIPLREMRGKKPTEATILEDWAWAYPTYKFETSKPISSVVLFPDNLVADINPENNTFTQSK